MNITRLQKEQQQSENADLKGEGEWAAGRNKVGTQSV